MIRILDTDHFSALERANPASMKLRERVETGKNGLFTTIITYEQVVRGWFARLKRCRAPAEEIPIYARLQSSARELAEWDILPWDEDAVRVFESLQRQRIRVGTMDLKIACIALAYDATVVTANTVDFAKVPGLRFENWLE